MDQYMLAIIISPINQELTVVWLMQGRSDGSKQSLIRRILYFYPKDLDFILQFFKPSLVGVGSICRGDSITQHTLQKQESLISCLILKIHRSFMLYSVMCSVVRRWPSKSNIQLNDYKISIWKESQPILEKEKISNQQSQLFEMS